MSAAYVYEAVRTPFGRYGGGLLRGAAPTIWPRTRSGRYWSACRHSSTMR